MGNMEEWTKETFLEKLESGEKGAFYLYTPFCGTCALAGKMLAVVCELLPELSVGKANINYLPELAEAFAIESVPCLLIFRDKKILEKIYAFRSVPYLYERLRI
jgi:thiol-disulfide isomerase/thioredoxin